MDSAKEEVRTVDRTAKAKHFSYGLVVVVIMSLAILQQSVTMVHRDGDLRKRLETKPPVLVPVPTRPPIVLPMQMPGSPNTTTTIEAPLPFPERWGPCDPRTIESYVPRGNVWFVSFAGWSETRKNNIRAVERNLALQFDGQLQLSPLLFHETDLPESYYSKFNWSYAKPEYRGFWTWKPWILRNLTETGVLDTGDLVFWMDSDRKFTKNTTYFRTALCNMEHRNDNYAGVFPFGRCQGNQESRNTKPETFDRMGLNRTKWSQGEQVYAGSIGFRITGDTLDFLKEWEHWGTIPVLFGDDTNFPSNPPPPRIYRRHKNDQSVFSLMVRSRNMKVWPAPYYDSKRSGINKQCHDRFQDAGYCFFFDNNNPIREICKNLEEWMEQLPLLT